MLNMQMKNWLNSSKMLSIANRCIRPFGVELSGHPNPTTLAWHLKTIVEYLSVNCVLDVGANRGQFADGLRRLGYRNWIVSFEPVPDAYVALSGRFGSDDRWRGFQIALGDRDEVRPFHIAGGDAQASSFLDFNEAGPARWGSDHTVQETVSLHVRRLDEMWNDCVRDIDSPRVFLKLDCQGFDLNVVEGAGERLQHVVAIQSELALEHFYDGMTEFTDAVGVYEKLGFDAVGFFPVAHRKPDFLRAVEMDCLFMRAPD